MAECIIARGGGRSDGGGTSGPPIISDKHTILVTVKSSNGTIIPNSSVHCKDGSLWYNYHTNDKGQVLFVTNSGSANITAWNFSINSNCRYADQGYSTKNIDAPIGLSTTLEIPLSWINSATYTSMTTNVQDTSKCFQGNYKVLAHNRVNVFAGGGGGGGGAGQDMSTTYDHGTGGGGGGIGISNGITVNPNSIYKIYVGSGGTGGRYQGSYGNSGGTSSAFGVSGNGGGGGSCGGSGGSSGSGVGQSVYSGGAGGYESQNGGASQLGNHGGGGGGGGGLTNWDSDSMSDREATRGGSPYGGTGGRTWNSPIAGGSATGYGGGGGGGGYDRYGGGGGLGGNGGAGVVKVTYY